MLLYGKETLDLEVIGAMSYMKQKRNFNNKFYAEEFVVKSELKYEKSQGEKNYDKKNLWLKLRQTTKAMKCHYYHKMIHYRRNCKILKDLDDRKNKN